MSQQQPLVSIVMPCRNAGKFLQETILSILEQTYSNWELIVINDHSEDNSEELLKSYSDKRIIWQDNKGKGIIDALQQAYELCNGEYITRMDADDIMPKQKIEKLLGACNNSKATVATGLVEYFHTNGALQQGYRNYESWLNTNLLADNPFNDVYKECVIPSPCWMVHKSVLENIGGFKSLDYPEDYDLVFHFLEQSLTVTVVPEVLHLWRDHGERASRNDDNYSENTFLPLKLKWLIKLNPETTFQLIGAGKKGKTIAKYFLEQEHNFNWFTNNEKKRSVPIYQKPLQALEKLSRSNNELIVVAVANPVEQQELLQCFENQRWQLGHDFVFFC